MKILTKNVFRLPLPALWYGRYFWQELKNNGFPDGYQVLCRNCNWLKEIRRREVIKTYADQTTKQMEPSTRPVGIMAVS